MSAARAVAAAITAVLAAGTLTGCSPATEPLLAVGRGADGLPVLHLRLCGDAIGARVGVSDMSLITDPSGPPSGPSTLRTPALPTAPGAPSWIWEIRNRTDKRKAWSIESYTVPAGWAEATFPLAVVGPVLMTPTGQYFASAGSRLPMPSPVDFTKADLDALADGQVIGHKGRSLTETILTLEEFRKQAEDAC